MRKAVLAAAAILAALLVLLATVLLIRVGILRSRERSAYRFALQDGLYALEQGRIDDAEAHLLRAAESAHSPEAWLRLLKHARRLPENELYRELLGRGYAAFPGSESLAAARGFRLLQEGEATEAWRILSREVDPDAYPALLSAALLAAEAEPGENASEEMSLFAALPESDTPDPFLRAYEFTGAVPFLDNALLLTLRDGDFDRAQQVLGRFPQPSDRETGASVEENDSPEIAERRGRLLITAAHTLEDRETFYTYLRALGGREGTRPLPLLLQADLRMSAREHEEAERLYRELRSVAPEFSPIPYLNGAWLLRQEGATALDLLRRGTQRFPEEERLKIALLKELIYHGNEEEARSRIALGSPSLMSKLLNVAFFFAPDVDRGYTPRLWQLFNEENSAPEVARLLAYHLVGVNDLAELQRLLDRFPEREYPWARFYLGYLALRRGLYGRADELFSNRPGVEGYPVEPWIWEANAALSALHTGSFRRSLENARRAQELLVSQGAADRALSHGTLLSLEAEALRLSGNRREALNVARRAVDLAPESSSARLVLRNLERSR